MAMAAAIAPAPSPGSALPIPRPEQGLSAIIASKHRARWLIATVESLLAQSQLPSQIIIVDQSVFPDARAAVCARAARFPRLRLDYVHDPAINGGAAARNRGMELADGAIWLFLDDDVQLEPEFIAALWAGYRWLPQATGISGIITNYAPPPWTMRLWTRLFCLGPFADDRQPIYWRAAALRHAPPLPVSRLGAGLMSFRASALAALRFDPRLTGASLGEDVDLCFRLPAGSTLFIHPAARLQHLRAPHAATRPYPLTEAAQAAWYLHLAHPRRHPGQRWMFAWLNAGLLLAAGAASLRRRSIRPWRDWWQGVAVARDILAR